MGKKEIEDMKEMERDVGDEKNFGKNKKRKEKKKDKKEM